MLHDLLSVNYDLIATEAKYHNCYALYTSIKSFKKKESEGKCLHEIAFQEMVNLLKCGRLLDMEIYKKSILHSSFIKSPNTSVKID